MIDIYQAIRKDAEEMGLSLAPQLASVIQKHLGLTPDEVERLGEHYYAIEGARLEKALAVSNNNIAYTLIAPFTLLLLQKKGGIITGYTQSGRGEPVCYKFTTFFTLSELSTHCLTAFDVHADSPIWYPDSWCPDQECIQAIVHPIEKKKSLFHR